MNTKWSERALQSFQSIAKYINDEFGKKAAVKFEDNVNHSVMLISKNPHMCPKELLLEDRLEDYHSMIVHRNCKIVYYVENEVVHIADLWDTRREPTSLTQSMK